MIIALSIEAVHRSRRYLKRRSADGLNGKLLRARARARRPHGVATGVARRARGPDRIGQINPAARTIKRVIVFNPLSSNRNNNNNCYRARRG